MSKWFCSAVAALLLCCLAAATGNAEVLLGAKKGLTISKFYSYHVEGEDYGFLAGFNGGFFLGFPLNPSFSLQVELLFDRRGASGQTEGADWSYTVSYIDVPVLAKLGVSLFNGWFRPSVYGGTQFSFALNQLLDMEVSYGSDYGMPRSALRNFDWGFVVGAEAAFQIKSYTLSIDLRYTLCLLPFLEPQYVNYQAPRLTYFSVLFGYGVRI